MTAASVTQSGAPDFTVNTFGADTHWFAVVARIHGSWRAAPFAGDYDRPTQIDASGVERHLVKAQRNGCGCAAGPETYTWYRFARTVFVPTAPPGPPAPCTRPALAAAGPLMRSRPVVEPELLGRLREPFRVRHFACADGWALATGTKGGHASLAVFEQQGPGWLRSAVGPGRLMGRASGPLAIPESVLRGLARRLRVHLGRTPHYSDRDEGPSVALPRPERTTVAIPVTPGSLYASDYASRRLVVALESRHRDRGRRATVTVHVFRWRRDSWSREAIVRFDRMTRFPQTSPERRYLSVNHDVSFTRSGLPDFTVGSLGLPGWFGVISHAGGTWHAIPFGPGRQSPVAIDGYTYFAAPHVQGFADSGRTDVEYRFAGGRFRVAWRAPQPACSPRTLSATARHRTHFTRSACAYGWALAFGAKRGKPVVGVFERGAGAGWSTDQLLSRPEFDARPDYTGIDPTLLKELERSVEAR